MQQSDILNTTYSNAGLVWTVIYDGNKGQYEVNPQHNMKLRVKPQVILLIQILFCHTDLL